MRLVKDFDIGRKQKIRGIEAIPTTIARWIISQALNQAGFEKTKISQD
jgi:hypothetical protein